MRAHWIKDLAVQESYTVKDEAFHHLVHVIRIQLSDELLLLNGNGLCVETRVEAVSKRELRLQLVNHYTKERTYHFDLILGIPKKEALELSLKQATELGFRNIFLIRSDYSQTKVPEFERIESLISSALEQSNAPYFPTVREIKWEDVAWDSYKNILMLDSQTKQHNTLSSNSSQGASLLIVGPEGGFSSRELTLLHSKSNIKIVNLPTPILRTPTALATGAGLMIESLLK